MKALLIVGAGGSGKTRRANEEAEKRGGNYVSTHWDEIQTPRGLGTVLKPNPQTVIVEGLPVSAIETRQEYLKQLVDGPVLIDGKHEDPRTVPAPMFIFTMLTPPHLDLSLVSGRRFEVINMDLLNISGRRLMMVGSDEQDKFSAERIKALAGQDSITSKNPG
jgi:hypothetical protein